MEVRCERCDREISEKYEYLGQTLCEDCYIDVRYPPKACDPWAVYSATRSRQTLGLKETEGLTDMQKQICEFVMGKGKVTREDVMKNFNLTEGELQAQVAVLRHCELIKGRKEGDRVFLVTFD
jgi:hypothetical protein